MFITIIIIQAETKVNINRDYYKLIVIHTFFVEKKPKIRFFFNFSNKKSETHAREMSLEMTEMSN